MRVERLDQAMGSWELTWVRRIFSGLCWDDYDSLSGMAPGRGNINYHHAEMHRATGHFQ